MAVLDDTSRQRTRNHVMRQNTETIAVTKPELLAAVQAADDWVEANSSSYNQALPLPARTSLTAAQKTAILTYVAMRRYGILTTQDD